MRRVIVIALAGCSLGGCSSFSWDVFKSTPPVLVVQLDSVPPGADARTSLGPGCKTPCSVTVPAPEGSGFTVNYTLGKFPPITVPVTVIRVPGDLTTSATASVDPNPVVAEFKLPGPPPRAHKMMRPKRPKKPQAAGPPPAEASPFPAQAPAGAPPPPPPPPGH